MKERGKIPAIPHPQKVKEQEPWEPADLDGINILEYFIAHAPKCPSYNERYMLDYLFLKKSDYDPRYKINIVDDKNPLRGKAYINLHLDFQAKWSYEYAKRVLDILNERKGL